MASIADRIAKRPGKAPDAAERSDIVPKVADRRPADRNDAAPSDLDQNIADLKQHTDADRAGPTGRAVLDSNAAADRPTDQSLRGGSAANVGSRVDLVKRDSIASDAVRNPAGAGNDSEANASTAEITLNSPATLVIAGINTEVAAVRAGHAAEPVAVGADTPGPATVDAAVGTTALHGTVVLAAADEAGPSRGTRCAGTAASGTPASRDMDSDDTDSRDTASRDAGITDSADMRSRIAVTVATGSPAMMALLIADVAADGRSQLTAVTGVITVFAATDAWHGAAGRGMAARGGRNGRPARISMRSSPRPTPTKTAS